MYPAKEEIEERTEQINNQLEILQKEEDKLTKIKEDLLNEKYILEMLYDFIKSKEVE